MSLYMETTKIPAQRTAGEICEMLAEAGANAILQEFDENRRVSSLSFRMNVRGQDLPFILPIRAQAILQRLQTGRKRLTPAVVKGLSEQAERVAWRQVLRWLQAQLALIETGMVETAEVFLPYMHVGINQTLFQRLAEKGFQKLLGPGEGGSK